ncbi:hypothetical protein CU633_22540 [Bacillus sp. V3-13]|nr:hypothetical protein CU633_22540 [Bacillus sp. V3-13]
MAMASSSSLVGPGSTGSSTGSSDPPDDPPPPDPPLPPIPPPDPPDPPAPGFGAGGGGVLPSFPPPVGGFGFGMQYVSSESLVVSQCPDGSVKLTGLLWT